MSTRTYAVFSVSAFSAILLAIGLFAFTKWIQPSASEIALWLIGVCVLLVGSYTFILTAQSTQQIASLVAPLGLALCIYGIVLMYKD